MEESISKFVTAILAIVIMFIFPVYIAYEKKDDISYALAVRYTQDFVDKVRSKGYITRELYQDYAARLLTTGNTYDIEMEHRYVRFDPNQATAEGEVNAVRNEEIYSTEYILDFLDSNEDHKYVMNVNDNFNVKIKNTNTTMATVIYNIVTVNMASSNVRIHVDYGGKILAEKWWGNIKFFQGDAELGNYDKTVIKVTAYKTEEDANDGINAIESGKSVIAEKTTQEIFYRVDFNENLRNLVGIVYDNDSYREEITNEEEPEGIFKIYSVTYENKDVSTRAEFSVDWIMGYGESITKKVSSPEFSIEFFPVYVEAYEKCEDNNGEVKCDSKIEKAEADDSNTISITETKLDKEFVVNDDQKTMYYKVWYEGNPSITGIVYEDNVKRKLGEAMATGTGKYKYDDGTEKDLNWAIYEVTYSERKIRRNCA